MATHFVSDPYVGPSRDQEWKEELGGECANTEDQAEVARPAGGVGEVGVGVRVEKIGVGAEVGEVGVGVRVEKVCAGVGERGVGVRFGAVTVVVCAKVGAGAGEM